ncbi:MAG TPA: hypothetical protein PKW79_03130 [Rhabdochlamydiaceae bacterium]|nr:hypothetical protein [Rhabdochlamydiaceae bacterium]
MNPNVRKIVDYTQMKLKIGEFGKAGAADLKQRSGAEAAQLE